MELISLGFLASFPVLSNGYDMAMTFTFVNPYLLGCTKLLRLINAVGLALGLGNMEGDTDAKNVPKAQTVDTASTLIVALH